MGDMTDIFKSVDKSGKDFLQIETLFTCAHLQPSQLALFACISRTRTCTTVWQLKQGVQLIFKVLTVQCKHTQLLRKTLEAVEWLANDCKSFNQEALYIHFRGNLTSNIHPAADSFQRSRSNCTNIFLHLLKCAGEGVCVQASTLGSLEALLEFLRSDAVKIPVSGINIGPVHKRDVMRASTMLEKGRKKFAVILAFDVVVTKEATEQANSSGVRIFTADIIYHLFDQFSAYLKHVSSVPECYL